MGWNPAHGEMSSMQNYDEVGKWLAAGQRFSPGTLVSITFDRHDKTEILLKVALITIFLPNEDCYSKFSLVSCVL